MIETTEKAEFEVKPSQKTVTFKTKLAFIDINRKHCEIVSVQPPQITQAGMLQFLLEDRLVSYPLMVIFRFETEQLMSIEPPKIIVGMEEK